MADIPLQRHRARGWGITATVIAGIGVLSVVLVVLPSMTVDQNFGWYLFLVVLAAFVMGAISAVLGIVGLVLARIDRSDYGWPVAGIALGAVQAIILAALIIRSFG